MNKHIARTFSGCVAQASMLLLACAFGSGAAFAGATLAPAFDPQGLNPTPAPPTGWVGEVEVSNFDFSSGNEAIFKTSFDKSNWTGNVFSYPVGTNGSLNYADERWGGLADGIDAQNYDTGRNIVTMKEDGTLIPFRWTSLSSNQQQTINKTDKTDKTGNQEGQNRLSWFRGDKTNEGTNGTKAYRTRTSVLGDIIHSRPLFVDDPAYPRLYVGANDGMLHAIDACNAAIDGCLTPGSEVFAYVPSMLIGTSADGKSALNSLWSGTYGTSSATPHQYYVDGSPNARVVTLGGATKTVLVGSLGAGGPGLYALDITNPGAGSEATDKNRIKWEITNTTINNTTSTAYQNLGNSYGVPIITRIQDGTWVAIVGNGYNNTHSYQASLFIINLDTGAKIAEMTASVTSAADAGHPNGLSNPVALDVNNDGKVDYVYAGDIAGNLWKFDLHTAGSYPNPSTPLFSTPNAAANQTTTNIGQSITGQPSLSSHPYGGYMVTFATGRMFTDCTTGVCDRLNTTQQYVYGIWDADTPAPGTALAGTTITSSKLVDQTLSAISTFSGNGLTFSVRTSGAVHPVDYTAGVNQKQGWRLLLASGERVVGDGGLIADGRYHVSVTNPNYDNGTGATRGDNWLLEVDMLTGMAPSSPFFDLNGDGNIDDFDLVADTNQGYQLRIPVARRISSGGVISQPLLAQLDVHSETYFNTNPDVALASTPGGGGITNGHFDWDIYYPNCVPGTDPKKGGYQCAHNVHSHQYDDKYNVTGVDMQASSLATVDLAVAFAPAKGSTTTTNTKFKILVANQALSPSAGVKIGDTSASYVQVTTYLTSATTALGTGTVLGTNTPFSSALPVYSLKGTSVSGATPLANMYINMPLQSFSQADWLAGGAAPWATSCNPATNPNCRVGLVPTQTGCVHANQTGYTDSGSTTLLPYGNLWMNGALIFQVIKDTTPDSAIRMERTGDPTFGYRLKSDTASQAYQLAMFTIFWHHPNGKCYGDSGWGTTAAIAYPDSAPSAASQTKAPGSDDPTDGLFAGGGGGGGSGGSQTGGGGTGGTTSTTTTIVLADGTTIVETVTRNPDGSVTITLSYPDGTTSTFDVPPGGGGKEADDRIKTGRISWKEMKRCPSGQTCQ